MPDDQAPEKVNWDISERKKTEEALKLSEDKYQLLFNSIDEGFCIIELIFDANSKPIDYRFLEINNVFEQQTGLQNAKGKLMRTLAPNLEEKWFRIYGEIALSGKSKRFTNEAKALNRWYDVYAFPVGEVKPYRVGVLFKDITQNKKAEEALKESEQLYRTLFENTEDALLIVEPIYNEKNKPIDSLIVKVNETWEKQTGLKAADYIGKRLGVTMPGMEPSFLKLHGDVRKSGKPQRAVMFNQATNNWYDIYAFPYKEKDVAILFRKVSEQKKAEEALKSSEEQLRKAIRDAPIPIVMHAEDGEVLQLSNTWTELTGCTINDVKNFDTWLTKVVYGEGANAVRDHMHALFAGHKKMIDIEFPIRALNGTIRYWSFSASSPGQLEDGRRFIIGMAVDITERKKAEETLKENEEAAKKHVIELERLQEQLEEKNREVEQFATKMESLAEERAKKLQGSERLAAIGATAGMVGHDIRNPLQVITGDIYLLNYYLADLPDGHQKSEMKESIDSINANVSYINKIVADLQDFSKVLTPEYSTFDLPKLIHETIKTIFIPDNINLSVNCETIRAIKSDQTYLRRSITNLVNNAIQAMPEGGNVEVSCFSKKSSVFITVSDTGVGIPNHVKAQLFTPMVTTKSKGQGLGLAVVKRLVEALGGTISFESEEGKGTKFIIQLPL